MHMNVDHVSPGIEVENITHGVVITDDDKEENITHGVVITDDREGISRDRYDNKDPSRLNISRW